MESYKPVEVFTLPPKLKATTTNHPDTVSGYYTYAWLSDEQVFYIGYGKGRKAWNLHNEEAEDIKFIARDFQVQIIRDGLSKLQAQDLKAKLIREFRNKGYTLCNVR